MADSAPAPIPPLDRARAKIRAIDDAIASARRCQSTQDALSTSLQCIELNTDVSYILWKETKKNIDNRVDDDIKSYEMFREYIIHEDNLRNSRTASLLTIQGFLFAAIGASAAAPANRNIYALQILIPIIGLAVTGIHGIRYVIQNAVYASLDNAFKKISMSDKFKMRYPTHLRYSGADQWRKFAEFVNYHTLFMIVWAAVLIYVTATGMHEPSGTLIRW